MHISALVLDVVLIEAQLCVRVPSVHFMLHLFVRDTFVQPPLELRVVEVIVTSSERGFGDIVDLGSLSAEESLLLHHE